MVDFSFRLTVLEDSGIGRKEKKKEKKMAIEHSKPAAAANFTPQVPKRDEEVKRKRFAIHDVGATAVSLALSTASRSCVRLRLAPPLLLLSAFFACFADDSYEPPPSIEPVERTNTIQQTMGTKRVESSRRRREPEQWW